MGTLVVAAAVPIVVVLVAVWSNGWTVTAVQTGSMEPHLPQGSAAVIEPVDHADIEPGTIIAFRHPRDDGRTIVHRVRRIVEQPGGRFFETQGDANVAPDGDLVPARMVEGALRTRVLGLGTVVDTLARPGAARLLIGLPIVLLVLNEAIGRVQRRRRHRARLELEGLRARVRELEELLAVPPPQP